MEFFSLLGRSRILREEVLLVANEKRCVVH
jgi:hypothetical protein